MTKWILSLVAVLATGLALAIGLPGAVPAAPPVASTAPVPELRGTPAQVARYFAGLPADAAVVLADRYPDVIGNLDGVPVTLRYRANAVRATGYRGRQLLGYGNGKLIEVVGDLSTARRIAILVPGVDTTLATFDTGLGGVLRRAPAWQARQLATAAGPGTAVVAWLGYDTPENARDQIRSERAEAGAQALSSFVAGLVAQCPHATIALIGYSYGTVVLGHAAPGLPAAVTDLVAIGSPGMDVFRADQLHTGARVWAGSDPGDWTLAIPDLRLLGAGHGTNPTRYGFGARPLDVHDAVGHDGYFVPGTTALASIARVVSGANGGTAPEPNTARIAGPATVTR